MSTKSPIKVLSDAYFQPTLEVPTMYKPPEKRILRPSTSKSDPGTLSDFSPSADTNFANLLPFAARAHHISSDPRDYIFRPVIIFTTELPNRNGVGFPTSELAKWSTLGGCQSYMTWKGKPMHIEHEADDPTTAIGIIVDVAMVPLRGFGGGTLWKVIALAAMDRTKDPIVGEVERGEVNTYSMGCLVDGYTCSYCGAEVGDCHHIDPKQKVVFYELNGKMVFKWVYGVVGQELSVVRDPAFGVATSDVDHIILHP